MWGSHFMKKLRPLCFAAQLCAAPAFSQDPGSAVLNGDITDPSGASVAGADIAVRSNAMSLSHTATGYSAGLFIIHGLVLANMRSASTQGVSVLW